METIKLINFIIATVFFVCYSYQFAYILVPYLKKEKPHKPAELHRYAVLISARNEELVIGNLLDSISGRRIIPRALCECLSSPITARTKPQRSPVHTEP